MVGTIALGPISLPFGLVVFVVALLVAFVAARRIAIQTGLSIAPTLVGILCVGVLMARLLFVVQHGEGYIAAPWRIFDIFDGGWKPTAGIGCAWLASLVMTRNTPQLRRPVLMAVAVFSIVSLMGLAIMLLPAAGTPAP